MTRVQLVEAGWGRGAIESARRSGWLHLVHVGVYSVTPTLTPSARCVAAVLATGGVLSHESAAAWHRLLAWRDGPVHVLTLRRARSQPGIVVHRTRRLPAADVQRRDGMAFTTATRTILDLAGVLPEALVLDAAMEALHRKVLDVERLRGADLRGHRGARTIDVLLGRLADGTHSALEVDVRELCRAAGLPMPVGQFRLGPRHHVDFAWPERKVALEADSWTFHGNQRQWLADHERNARAVAKGWQLLRFNRVQIREQPGAVIAALRAALAEV
nr:DUF559 domain-containing protein [Conexibacter sp. SYSU D00693]